MLWNDKRTKGNALKMKVKYSQIIMWLLIISPIVDNINGYMLLNGQDTSISIMYKTVTFLICLLMLLKIMTSRNDIAKKIAALVFFAIQMVVFELNYAGSFGENFSALIKLLMPMVVIMTIRRLKDYDSTVEMCVEKISSVYCWVFPISLIIPMILDVGFHTYGSQVGNKGFYYAGNEISAIMVIVLSLEIEKYKEKRSRLNFLNIVLGAVGTIFIGTKSGYISLIILILVGLYSEQNINKKILSVCLIIPSVFGGLWYVINNVDMIIRSIDAMMWKYRHASGIINFLLSGREMRPRRAFRLVYSNKAVWKLIWGIGSYAAEKGSDPILIEMDLFDLLIRFGMIVTLLIILFYSQYIKMVVASRKTTYIVGIILIYGISVISGHVLFAPMVSITLSILLLKIEFIGVRSDKKQTD